MLSNSEGLANYNKGDYAAAADIFRQTIRREPHNFIARIYLVDCCRLMGLLDEARAEIIAAIHPDLDFQSSVYLAESFLRLHDSCGMILPDEVLRELLLHLPKAHEQGGAEHIRQMCGRLLFLLGPSGEASERSEDAGCPEVDFDQLDDVNEAEKYATQLFGRIADEPLQPLAWARAFHCSEAHMPHRTRAKACAFAHLAGHSRPEVRESIFKGLEHHVAQAIFANNPADSSELYGICEDAYKKTHDPMALPLLSKLSRFLGDNDVARDWINIGLDVDPSRGNILNEAFKVYTMLGDRLNGLKYLISSLETDYNSTFWDTEFDLVDGLTHDLEMRNIIENWIENYAATHERSNVRPAMKTRRAFLELVDLRRKRLEQNLPSCLLVTLPKSGTVSVGSIFNHGFGLANVNYFFNMTIVVSAWINDYARGGCCSVRHVEPTAENIKKIVDSGMKKVIVHLRDIRQVAVSLGHHLIQYKHTCHKDIYQGTFQSSVMRLIRAYVRWINGWLDVYDSGQLDVTFTSFETMVRQPDVFLDQIVTAYGGDRSLLDMQAIAAGRKSVDTHFRKGKVDEWRSCLPADQIEYLYSMIPERFYRQFGWMK